jgi:hypothetical protein
VQSVIQPLLQLEAKVLVLLLHLDDHSLSFGHRRIRCVGWWKRVNARCKWSKSMSCAVAAATRDKNKNSGT